MRPIGLGFSRFWLIFGTLVPVTTAHPKLVALVRNKQNMYGTWGKAHVIPEKLTVKIGNNGRQHPLPHQAKTCARPQAKLRLRIGGLGVASMPIPRKYLVLNILL